MDTRTIPFSVPDGSAALRTFTLTYQPETLVPTSVTKRNHKLYGLRQAGAAKNTTWIITPNPNGDNYLGILTPIANAVQLHNPKSSIATYIDIDCMWVGGDFDRGKRNSQGTITFGFLLDCDGNAYPIQRGRFDGTSQVSFPLGPPVKAVDLIGEELYKKFVKASVNKTIR